MESLWNPGQTLDKAKGTRKQEIQQKVTPRPCLLNAGLLIPVIPVCSSLRLQTPILQLFCFWPMETGSLLLSLDSTHSRLKVCVSMVTHACRVHFQYQRQRVGVRYQPGRQSGFKFSLNYPERDPSGRKEREGWKEKQVGDVAQVKLSLALGSRNAEKVSQAI